MSEFDRKTLVREIALYFLRLGATGFGGPLAIVAQMQRDLVDDKKWLDKDEFNQVIPLIKAMPGALGFSVASYMGYRRGGLKGGVLAGWCLVAPAFFLMILIAGAYDQMQSMPLISSALLGMQASALALVLFSIRSLIKGYEREPKFWVLFLSGIGMSLGGGPEPLIILIFALLSIVEQKVRAGSSTTKMISILPLLFFTPTVADLFMICFRAGALVFGSGLAIVPLLETDFVDKMGWLTHSQFIDALAFGQMTPGPVLITVTFVGYKLSGIAGALAATLGVFLPSQFHMVTWFPKLTTWLSAQRWISAFVLGALAAVVSSLVLTSYKLCLQSSVRQNIMTAVLLAIAVRFKIPSWLLIAGGAGIGIVWL